MTTLPATDEHDDGGLAARIRIATADAHRAAEHAPFVQDLLAGRLPVEEYARLVAQHEAIYRVLEALVAANRDPTLAPFFVPELVRLPALEADLAFLAGDDWRERLTLVEATRDYCDHLRGLATSWPREI
ncbi:MAG: biliverdin-producing heme oxygenase, partial [Acidimicrobiia bacterium]